MNKKETYQKECQSLIDHLKSLTGSEAYYFAQGLEGAIVTASGVVADDQDVRSDTHFQQVLTEATNVVLQFEKDNPEFQ